MKLLKQKKKRKRFGNPGLRNKYTMQAQANSVRARLT